MYVYVILYCDINVNCNTFCVLVFNKRTPLKMLTDLQRNIGQQLYINKCIFNNLSRSKFKKLLSTKRLEFLSHVNEKQYIFSFTV